MNTKMFFFLVLVGDAACARFQQTLNTTTSTTTNQQKPQSFPYTTELNSFCWKDSEVREPGFCSDLRNRWGEAPPPGWVNCGMGAAKTKKICAKTIAKQVFATLKMISEVAALILSGATSGPIGMAIEAITNKLAKAQTMVR